MPVSFVVVEFFWQDAKKDNKSSIAAALVI
jgi:hypothetical protein